MRRSSDGGRNGLDAKDWLPILFERTNFTGTLWNIELAAIVGIIAFLASAVSRLNWVLTIVLLLGYWMMALSNLYALYQVIGQRAALAKLILKMDNASQIAEMPLQVPPLRLVVWGHLATDVLVSLFVWFYPIWAPRG
jgi:hypothetical protein